MPKFLNILLLCCLFISSNVFSTSTIQVVTEFMPPLQLAKPGEKVHGISADIVNEVIEDSQIESVSNVYPWARSYILATTKPNVLIYPIIRTKERENQFHWVGKIWEFSAAIYSHKNLDQMNISSLEDAKKYKIAVYRNDFFHHYLLDQGFSNDLLFPVVDIEQSIQLFLNNRVDLIVIDSSIFEYYLGRTRHDISDYQQLITLNNIQESNAFIALSKSTSQHIVDKLMTSFKRVSNRRLLN